VDIIEFGLKINRMNYIVITSINQVTEAIEKFSRIDGWQVVVVADLKSVPYEYDNVKFLTVQEQRDLGFNIFDTTPYNHYSRKNLGYLYSISQGAEYVYDTDDDTIPYENWDIRDFKCSEAVSGDKYINPFSFFTDQNVWPRGYHLPYINKEKQYIKEGGDYKVGVWQGVIDGDSDFDAIYRLTIDKHVKFNDHKDIVISPNSYSPFNTQSTLWNKNLYSLMYVPITVDFRFTDILRGYVTQRIMWNYGYRLGFHSPNTYQIRNAHDYYKDFLGELSMYQNIPKVVEALDQIELSNESIEKDLILVYSSLENRNIVSKLEIDNLNNWIKDINNLKCQK
jgi:hypothetical protein